MIEDFDITCTATLRPELLEKTLSTHIKYLFGECIKKARLIINIDYAGVNGTVEKMEKKCSEIEDVLDQYPFRHIVMRQSFKPHFPTAFLWCMSNVEAPLLFHLEEDWELTMPIDFCKMFHLFAEYKDLVHLRLSSFRSTKYTCKNWNKMLYWNGKFFEVKQNEKCVVGWAGHPGFTRASFMKNCIEFMDPNVNPEKQVKGRRGSHPINTIINMSRFGCFHPQESNPAIKDIGRQWMIENGFKKKGNKAFFVEWERSDD